MTQNVEMRAERPRKERIENCADYFYYDPRENRYTNNDLFPIMDTRFERNISIAVWEDWRRIVINNIDDLTNSNSFDEVCKKLERLKIEGIGSEAIILTAAEIAYKYDLPIDDSCWNVGFLQKASVIKLLKLHCHGERHIVDFLREQILHFGDLDLTSQIMCVIANSSIIRQSISRLNIE